MRIGVFTDAPRELADVALAHVGAARRVEAVGTLDEVLAELGGDAVVVRSRERARPRRRRLSYFFGTTSVMSAPTLVPNAFVAMSR